MIIQLFFLICLDTKKTEFKTRSFQNYQQKIHILILYKATITKLNFRFNNDL